MKNFKDGVDSPQAIVAMEHLTTKFNVPEDNFREVKVHKDANPNLSHVELVWCAPHVQYLGLTCVVLVQYKHGKFEVAHIGHMATTNKCAYCGAIENLGTQEGKVVCEECAMSQGE